MEAAIKERAIDLLNLAGRLFPFDADDDAIRMKAILDG